MTEADPGGGPGRKAYRTQSIMVTFEAGRCRHAAECVRGLPEVFDTTKRPWIQPERASADRLAEVVRRCPSGALRYERVDGGGENPDRPDTVTAVPAGG
ncbi:(4Fe-4S)-binding protein [Streptomyces sp. NPDC012623]|uniref:(4Fe-4S)-binding protein n=1 Tax=unclassified Streptomyces TaxID=2593676 RepID=UPI0036B6D0D8